MLAAELFFQLGELLFDFVAIDVGDIDAGRIDVRKDGHPFEKAIFAVGRFGDIQPGLELGEGPLHRGWRRSLLGVEQHEIGFAPLKLRVFEE